MRLRICFFYIFRGRFHWEQRALYVAVVGLIISTIVVNTGSHKIKLIIDH